MKTTNEISQECFYKVWVKNDYADQVIRSTLNSDIELTDKFRYGNYDDLVIDIYNKIQNGKLFKLEYKGNIAGWFIWIDKKPSFWYLNPEFRTEHFLKCLNIVVNGTYYLEVTMNDENIKVASTNIFSITEWKNI